MRSFMLAASAAISLFAASGVAHAGEVISDQRYWPSEVNSQQRYWPNEAYGYGYYAGSRHPAFNAVASMYPAAPTTGSSFVYRGGPKTGTRDYNYAREW
jgi:hypothetical protein